MLRSQMNKRNLKNLHEEVRILQKVHSPNVAYFGSIVNKED